MKYISREDSLEKILDIPQKEIDSVFTLFFDYLEKNYNDFCDSENVRDDFRQYIPVNEHDVCEMFLQIGSRIVRDGYIHSNVDIILDIAYQKMLYQNEVDYVTKAKLVILRHLLPYMPYEGQDGIIEINEIQSQLCSHHVRPRQEDIILKYKEAYNLDMPHFPYEVDMDDPNTVSISIPICMHRRPPEDENGSKDIPPKT